MPVASNTLLTTIDKGFYMITCTSLKHPTVKREILRAVANVAFLGYSVDHIRDSSGKAYMAVRLRCGEVVITDSNHTNITETVYKSLRG